MDSTAGIVIIGDEILSGKFAEENARFLIGELRELGVTLRRISIIPDEVDDIAETVRRHAQRFDHVFTSGGVGPTHDDVTMAGVARAFGVEVVMSPELGLLLEEAVGRPPTPEQLRLTRVPAGAELLPTAPRRWPVVRCRNVHILPGVPGLLQRKFHAIRERFRAPPFTVGRLYCSGEESELAADLDATVAEFPAVKFGSYPRFEESEFDVILTVEGKDAVAVQSALARLAARLGRRVLRMEPARPVRAAPDQHGGGP